jgi:glyoxylase-like metal-dependent hydrolase (beta-lactamase superfamily II)
MTDTGRIDYPWAEPPAEGTVQEVAEGILWARLPLPLALDHVNVYFLREGAGWAMVDTGFDSPRTRAIVQTLIDGPLGGLPIVRVLVTHHHPDHVGLAGWIMAQQGAELLMPRTAWLTARMLTIEGQDLPPAQTLSFWHVNGMAPEVLERRRAERPFNFADRVHLLPLGFTRLEAGTRIALGGREWDVVFGQGHAPDHAVLYQVDGPLVIAGDQLLPSISPNIGVYPTEPEADPVAEWLTACAALAPLARPDHLVLPGHKVPFTGLPVRMRQLADNHHGALDRLLDHLATPRTGGECFAPLFKRQVTDGIYGLAFAETIAHLNHLWKRGDVRRTPRADGVFEWAAI